MEVWACLRSVCGRVQVEVVTQQITKLFRKCEVRLTQFGGEPASSEADEKVRRGLGSVVLALGAGCLPYSTS
jgi:hypothetical protein